MDMTFDIFFGLVNELVRVIAAQFAVGLQSIRKEFGTRLDMLLDKAVEFATLAGFRNTRTLPLRSKRPTTSVLSLPPMDLSSTST